MPTFIDAASTGAFGKWRDMGAIDGGHNQSQFYVGG